MKFNQRFEIDGRAVGEGCPAYVIAEAGVSHFGSEEKALRLVDLAVEAKADAIKFQIFDVEALISSELAEWRERLGSRQLPYEAFSRIQRYCQKRNITFFATAHDEQSLEYLASLRVPVYKIGSGEVGNWPYLRRVASLGMPVIFSTGMYRIEQVQQALETFAGTGNGDIAVLHCVTRYPTPPEEACLGNIAVLRERFNLVTGYSDHTKGFHFPLAAVALGARIVEKHISLDFDVPNAQDWKVSCGPHDLGVFVSQLREIERGLGMKQSAPSEGEQQSLQWAAKSLVAARDIDSGETLAATDFLSKRPGTGISPSDMAQVIGRQTRVKLTKDMVIRWEHLA